MYVCKYKIDSSLLSLVLVCVLVSLCACYTNELFFFLFLAALQGSHEAANPSRVYYAGVDKLGRVSCPRFNSQSHHCVLA